MKAIGQVLDQTAGSPAVLKHLTGLGGPEIGLCIFHSVAYSGGMINPSGLRTPQRGSCSQ